MTRRKTICTSKHCQVAHSAAFKISSVVIETGEQL